MDFELRAFETELSQSLGLAVRGSLTFGRFVEFSLQFIDPGQNILIPTALALQPGARADNLWKTTCAELFLARKSSTEYLEINLAPSGEWNSYEFTDYRCSQGNSTQTLKTVTWTRVPSGIVCQMSLELASPYELDAFNPTCVVATKRGHLHFAVQHPSDKPDFHKRDYYLNYATRR